MPTGVEVLVKVIAGPGQLVHLWKTCRLHIKTRFTKLTELSQVLIFICNTFKEYLINYNLLIAIFSKVNRQKYSIKIKITQ